MIPTEKFQKYYGVLNLDADITKSLKASLTRKDGSGYQEMALIRRTDNRCVRDLWKDV